MLRSASCTRLRRATSVKAVRSVAHEGSITLFVSRDDVERLARRAITDEEFVAVVRETQVSISAELRMILMLIVNEQRLAQPAQACPNCGEMMDGIQHGHSPCNEEG